MKIASAHDHWALRPRRGPDDQPYFDTENAPFSIVARELYGSSIDVTRTAGHGLSLAAFALRSFKQPTLGPADANVVARSAENDGLGVTVGPAAAESLPALVAPSKLTTTNTALPQRSACSQGCRP